MANRRGQAGVITAILAPVIVGAAGLAIDVALWQVNQRSLQGAADQASIAGVNAYILSGNTGGVATDSVAQQAALAVAKSFGYDACAQTPTNGCPCTSGFGACAGLPIAPKSAQCIANPGNCLQVTITEQQQRYLSQLVYSGNPVSRGSATTLFSPGGACVLALDQNPPGGGPPPLKAPSLSLGGSSEMDLIGCNLVNNLNDPDATQNDTTITGSSVLSATNGGQILLAQTKSFFGTGQVSPTPIYGTSPAPDPYASRAAPTVSSTLCTYPNALVDTSSPITTSVALLPGIYCGGLNINGGTITLAPGVYIMDGNGFSAAGNANITGVGVTIYVTCDPKTMTYTDATGSHNFTPTCSGVKYGGISITGTGGNCPGGGAPDENGVCVNTSKTCNVDADCPAQGAQKQFCFINPTAPAPFFGYCGSIATGNIVMPKVTLTPPLATTNPPTGTAGISMWVDRNAPIGGSSKFTGDANLNINGAIYAPSQAVTYEGGSAATSTCSQLIGLTINMSGAHDTVFSQAGCTANSGVASSSKPKLVE